MSARRLSIVMRRTFMSRGGPTSAVTRAASADASEAVMTAALGALAEALGSPPAPSCPFEQAAPSMINPTTLPMSPLATSRIYDGPAELAHEIVTGQLPRRSLAHSDH